MEYMMYATWFVLEKNDAEYFANIINNLSKKYGAQPFKPHITAYGLVDIDLDRLDQIVSDSIKGEKQIVIEKSVVSFSDVFWKTLFVEFKPNRQLERINKKLTESLDEFAKYEFIPHVSLIYQNMEESEQKRLADTIQIRREFTVVGMVIQKFHEDIDKWKIVRNYFFDSNMLKE